MHNIANEMKNQGRLVEAKSLNDESLSIAEKLHRSNKIEERAYMAMLNLKAHIIMRSLRQSVPAPTDANKQEHEAKRIYLHVFEQSFNLFGVADSDTWKAVNNSVSTLLNGKCYKGAIRIVLKLGNAALTADLILEGQLLETFGLTLNLVQSLELELPIVRDPILRHETAIIQELLGNKMARADIKPDDPYKWPYHSTVYGGLLISKGLFRQGEQALLRALSMDLKDKEGPETCKVIDYNMMLAIARQPGRQAEAYAFREKHIDEIADLEAKYGELPARLQQDREDLTVYKQAKSRLEGGQLVFGDEWWVKNEKALNRAELRYDLLFTDIPTTDDPELEAENTDL